MGLLSDIANGDSYDITVIRREKTSNGIKNVKDKAAKIEDSDTNESLLKMKSDGLKVPRPESQQFETLWYKDFLDKVFSSKSHTDFMEIYLRETGEDVDGDYVKFDPEEEGLDLMGSESQFQTHRDLEAEKTLDIFSEEGNQEWYFLAGLGVITMINLGGMYIIVSGLDQAIVSGVEEGFKTVQGNKGVVTGNWVLFSFAGAEMLRKTSNAFKAFGKSVKEHLKRVSPW